MVTSSGPAMPTRAEAESLAASLLGGVGQRVAHVRTAGRAADGLSVLFDEHDAHLLVVAATLHDIGYSPQIARTGFHPLDGALFLREQGYPQRLACLVAHHSLAALTAQYFGIHDLEARFPREVSLLADALVFADMHSAPDGTPVLAEQRLTDIERRHPRQNPGGRSALLRAALVRVGSALEEAQRQRRTIDLTERARPRPAQRGIPR